MTTLPRKVGWSFAGVHLALVVAAAIWIVAAFPRDGESPMLWLWVMLLDFPVSYLWGPFDRLLVH
jgi:hypothetical protein